MGLSKAEREALANEVLAGRDALDLSPYQSKLLLQAMAEADADDVEAVVDEIE